MACSTVQEEPNCLFSSGMHVAKSVLVFLDRVLARLQCKAMASRVSMVVQHCEQEVDLARQPNKQCNCAGLGQKGQCSSKSLKEGQPAFWTASSLMQRKL